MLQHNLLIALRNFKRFKSSFFINLIGLSTGLTCALLIYLWVNDELQVDKFHKKDERLFQVMEHQVYSDGPLTTTSTPGILAETLAEEIPEVEYAATTTWINPFTLSVDDHNIKAEGYYVGKDFFNIFSYGLQQDPNQVLADKSSIVISENLAMRLFGTKEGVIGKEVNFQHQRTFLVSGIFDGAPSNSSYEFDFVLSFEVFKETNDWVLEWGNNGPKTYITLYEGSDYHQVSDKISNFIKDRNEGSLVTLFLKPYSENYLYGRYENMVQIGGRIEYVRLFSTIAILVLIIACINFMNLSTARASRRAKEIGIKKAIGAKQKSLVSQHLGESAIMTFLSMMIAILLVLLLLPEFNEITDKDIVLSLDVNMILWFLGLGIITTLFSGSYPALYLTRFAPAKVLKGEIRGSVGELWARRGLVVVQFVLSIMLIVGVGVIYKQIDFVQSKNLGYNKENVIYFEIEGQRNIEQNLETFLNEIRQVPGVVSASTIGHTLLSQNSNTRGLEWEGKSPETQVLFERVPVHYDLIETMGFEIIEGRSFSSDFSTDTTKIIFNEAAIEVLGFDDPIGKTIKLWNRYDMEIIGVVRDFHFQSLHETVNPLFFMLNPENTWNAVVRIEAGREKKTVEALRSYHAQFSPDFAFDFHFQDEDYDKLYAAETRVSTLSRYFAALAILISCLGLFGLAAFTAERRTKEIGIRKALGSSITNIIMLLSKDFTFIVIVSMTIGLPISYLMLRQWLDRFAYHIDLGIWYFAGAGLIALLIAWLTVGSQALKAANVNISQCLRDE